MHHRVIIVGGGPAGCSAAIQCKRLGLEPLVLEQSGRVGGRVKQAFRIENYLGMSPITGREYERKLRAHFDSFGIVVEQMKVSKLSYDGGLFSLTDGSKYKCADAVILAVGTSPKMPMNIDDKVINTLPVYLSGESLFEMTNKPSHVVVVGGGECALDYSLSLQSYGCDTHVLVRGSSLKAAARLIAEAERKKGIHFHFHTSVHGIYKGVLGVRVKIEGPSGCKELKTDAVMIAIGQESNAASLVRGLTVCSKERIATELSRLYIVGDARTTTLGQVGISVGDGIAAAMAVNRQLLRDESLKGKK